MTTGCECETRHRARVFCASLADWLDDEVPIEWLADLLKLIHDSPNLDWLLLTKRPENFERRLEEVEALDLGEDVVASEMCSCWLEQLTPANVWIGATVEDQRRAEERIPDLLKIPSKVRFLSVEPMLEAVNLERVNFPTRVVENVLHTDLGPRAKAILGDDFRINGIDWVIVGGESGRNFRSCNMAWIRGLVEQCKAAGVPCFVKQMGVFAWFDETRMEGMKFKHPKGGDLDEWPEDLRVREFPNVTAERQLCPTGGRA